MFADKVCWIEPAIGFFAITWSDKRRDELAHFEMEMGKILPAGGSDRRDFLAAVHIVASMDQYFLAMAVIGLNMPAGAALFDRV